MQPLIALASSLTAALLAGASSGPFTQGHYRVLTVDPDKPAPFAAVEFGYGPSSPGRVAWQVSIRGENRPDAPPLVELRAATSRDPLSDSAEPLTFLSYQLRIPQTGETLEYANIHTGRPLLPAWGDFEKYFVPRPAKGARRQSGMPNTCDFLGHLLTLVRVEQAAAWADWPSVRTLRLDPELLIGTGRNFKDREGRRLPQHPQRQNYDYVPFTPDDYRLMIEAGVNLFTVAPDQEALVRAEPVFYIRPAGGKPPLQYPADLYRSNYLGPVMFMDEPTILMIGDKNIHNTLRYFSDAANLITRRVEARYLDDGGYGAYSLAKQLGSRVSLGGMRLAQLDYPAWETVYETAWYQLAGGLAGVVHEGRYQLGDFNACVRASTGLERPYTAEQMFRYVFAHLRGAARQFNKDWGISIYGQADPNLSPLAMRMAYDRGARYLWYWTSDHDHHLPWPEQLELTRVLRRHAAERPRASIGGPRPTLDKAIAIPYGYFVTLESDTDRTRSSDLWWVRELDPQKKNEFSRRYRRLVSRVFEEVERSLERGEEFDILVDDGAGKPGYREVVRVSDE